MANRIDPNAMTPKRIRRNFQRLARGGSTASIVLGSNSGLKITAGALSIALDTNPGLVLGPAGIKILLPANSGLQLAAGGLSVALQANSGLTLGATGLALDVLTTKGDLLTFSTVFARQAVSATNNQALVSDSTQTNGLNYKSVPITLFTHFVDAGNSTTVETDLYSDTIAAGQLAINGQSLDTVYGLTIVNSASTKQVRVYFAGTVIFDTGALTSTAAGFESIDVKIIRVSASVIRYTITAVLTGLSTASFSTVGELTGLTLANTNILKITGTAAGGAAATNDIVAKMGRILFTGA